MKCALTECNEEAAPGWPCCNPSHGYQLRNRLDDFQTQAYSANESNRELLHYQELLKTDETKNWYKPMRIDYTVEDAEHYAKFIKR